MAKRLTPFIGLAVVAALALAAAFGAFSLNPAYAGDEAPNARGLAQPVDFQSQAAALPVPTSAIQTAGSTNVARTDLGLGANRPGNTRLAKGDEFTVDVASAIVYTADPVVPADQINTYYLNLQENGVIAVGADLDFEADGFTPVYASTVQATASSTEVTLTAIGEGVATLTITADDSADNPATHATEAVVHSTYVFRAVVRDNTLEVDSSDPGANTRYDVQFVATSDLPSGVGVITIELEDFGFPGSAQPAAVGVTSDAYYNSDSNNPVALGAVTTARYNVDGSSVEPANSYQGGLVAPTDVTISGEKLKISVPDMNPETDRSDGIRRGDLISVLIRQGAGINNPSEGADYKAVITNNEDTVKLNTNNVTVPFLVELNEEDGGRGTTVTATGKGFKNGVSLGFFLDERTVHVDNDNNPATPASRDNGIDDDGDNMIDEEGEVDGVTSRNPNGMLDPGEVELCTVASVGSNDTGSCTFTVNNPPFIPGYNFVNAVDGRNQRATEAMNDDQRFELTPSITATPNGGNPGETILVQGYDFPAGSVTRVRLARQNRDARGATNTNGLVASITGSTAVGANGDLSFRLIIPNWAIEGRQDLQVTAGGSSDNITVTIGGPRVTVTPATALPNQRVSLIGTGFTPDSRITGGADPSATPAESDPSITIGGFVIPDAVINEGDPVTVDNGGKWSASVDLPLRDVTTRDGEREIRVTDSQGRSGTVSVTIPARKVTIDPPAGRIGTTATIRGENFPSKNDQGESFNIQITYDPGSNREVQVSTVSDASGNFEAKLRVPSGAVIPSTNVVRVTFNDSEGVPVTTTVSHEVPEGNITLSANSGAPGSTITLRGEGFKAFVPVRSVKVGSIDVIPSPAPSTNGQGMMEFEILIPGLESGIQTIEVQVSDTTASRGFTVTTAADIGAETPVAEGVANLGDNFVRAFNFNNDTKTWTFYDPEVADESTMEFFIAGASYWVLVGSTADAILNRETRTLTCVDDNCWNLIVW